MFAVIGFIACLLVLGYLSLAWLLVSFDCLGDYNIGGVPNSFGTKIFVLAAGALLVYLWILLFTSGPFIISIQ